MTASVDRREREWLLRLAKDVSSELRDRNELAAIVLPSPSSLRAEPTDTDGWLVDIGRLTVDRGSGLQLWLDMWPSPKHRTLYVCYKGSSAAKIRRIAAAGSTLFGRAFQLKDSAWINDLQRRYAHLEPPLEASRYGKPVAELLQRGGSWSFYGVYFRQRSRPQRPPHVLVARAARFLEAVARSVLAQVNTELLSDQAYSEVENRQKVVEHLKRERSRKLSELAKLRDGYTCQVCSMTFEERYGKLGRGFAEAHHRVALSKLRPGIVTHVRQLTTVCANCHRMLHQMKGKATDVLTLKRLVGRHR